MTLRKSFGFTLNVAIKSDVGRVRSNNEDAFGLRWLSDGSLYVTVADGMGGHEAGEVASGLAVRVLEEVIERDVDGDPRERMYNGLIEANQSIIDEGRASSTRGMGTTAVMGLLRGAEVHVALVGDSRLYHFRKGKLMWRTLDHTRVQMLLDQGEINEDDARSHPEAGMLTRALGHAKMADGRPLLPDVLAEPLFLEPDDLLVLSSDGLHDLLEDWEIGKLAAGLEPDEACDVLIKEACERGGHDNVTVCVITAGTTSAPFDSDFQAVALSSPADALPDDEGTVDEYSGQDADAPVPVVSAPPAPMNVEEADGNNTMMIVGVVAAIVVVVGGGLALMTALGAGVYIWGL